MEGFGFSVFLSGGVSKESLEIICTTWGLAAVLGGNCRGNGAHVSSMTCGY